MSETLTITGFEELKVEEKEKIQKELGKTYILIQEFEYNIKYLLWLLSSLQYIDVSVEIATGIMENVDKKQLVK